MPNSYHEFNAFLIKHFEYSPTTKKFAEIESTLVLQSDLLALDSSDNDIGGVLGDDFIVVQHLELL